MKTSISDISIIIFSNPDYEKLVSEIYYKDDLVFFLNQDEGIDHLEVVFPNDSQQKESCSPKFGQVW